MPVQVEAQTPPPVLAFYYAWFDETTWVSGKPADLPTTSYRSADPAIIERHVIQAKGAGIDAFVQSWYGPQVENNQTEPNFKVLLDTAQRYQFQAAVDFEVVSPFFADLAAVENGLQALLQTHIHHPAYLRFQGKPVIFFWREQRFSVDVWRDVRNRLDPNHNTLWIAEGIDLSYQDVFDGHHLYSIAWAASPSQELNKWPPRIKQVEERLGQDKLWVATVMAGYDDLRLNRPDSFTRSREGGDYYRQTWQAAQATQPDLLIINSFNEWLEGTQIEPSVTYGDFYLDLTRELIGKPASVPPSDEIGEGQYYLVLPGDTLYGIALAHNLRVADIIVANNLTDPNRLRVGQRLWLGTTQSPAEDVTQPEPESPSESDSPSDIGSEQTSTYIVQAGDTLYGIALQFELTIEAILAVNDLSDPSYLKIDQVLNIPTR
ncbi:MAG: LysM peptidoglycan-binding domain-containing protein [Chloroflexota bacterium]